MDAVNTCRVVQRQRDGDVPLSGLQNLLQFGLRLAFDFANTREVPRVSIVVKAQV